MEESSVLHFQKSLSNLMRARFPFLYIPTWEEERVLSLIRLTTSNEALIKTVRKVFTWSLTSGLAEDGQTGREETKTAIKCLEFIETYDHPAVFILKDFHMFFGGVGKQPDYHVIRKLRDLLPVLKQSASPKNVIIVSPTLVLPTELEKEMTIVDFSLPSFTEIKDVLSEMIEANKASGRIIMDLTSEDEERLAKAALGLTLHEAENAFARAMVENGRLDKNDVEIILEEKRQIIKKSEILEFIKTDLKIEDVGGLENLKRWLFKRNKSWLDSAVQYGLPAPKGALITGVPGCGKSLIAKAISAMWQLPLLRLDLGKIFSGIVGSSEENMRKAIKTVEAISPSILWIDEIEKGFSGISHGGDSGTSNRIFGTFLTWMQEKTKPVFVIATANNIHALPAEMLRKGRFDEIFFVDLPTKKERKDIFRLHIHKRLKSPRVIGEFQLTEDTLEQLAELTEGYVGAEVEQTVITALFEAFSEERSIRLEDFIKAIRNTVPLSITQAEQIQSLRDWANVRAVAATVKEDRLGYLNQNIDSKTDASKGEDIKLTRGGRAVDF
ncbi:AAA family ATPase [Paenibacillus elgii]|uniref:AAA family ATPase n=1 Tax=Paenibacillus elgii TaxID=189691 RepID=UPI00203ACAAE|nr:AAA family ATPase [Paenibacillus elgii]MCM3269885.1 AAA family ATPase [Paenibacillus elgii]